MARPMTRFCAIGALALLCGIRSAAQTTIAAGGVPAIAYEK
jgi:hypothetical protein